MTTHLRPNPRHFREWKEELLITPLRQLVQPGLSQADWDPQPPSLGVFFLCTWKQTCLLCPMLPEKPSPQILISQKCALAPFLFLSDGCEEHLSAPRHVHCSSSSLSQGWTQGNKREAQSCLSRCLGGMEKLGNQDKSYLNAMLLKIKINVKNL